MTMTLIETKTLGTAAGSIEFTSIPQDGTDLVIYCSTRSSRNTLVDSVYLEPNGVRTGSTRRLIGDGSATSSDNVSDIQNITSDSNNTANTFGNLVFYIPNYTSATNKSISSDGVSETNSTTAFQLLGASLWTTTDPLTSVTIVPGTGPNFVAGSTISLYKITKGSDGIVTTS